jgi:tetratricopeptide (TPR) repeat protein
MSLHRITIVALVAAAGIGGALACGPDFPWQLLDDRSATLLDAPAGLSFLSQLRSLVTPQGPLKVVEHDDDDDRKLEPFKIEEDEAMSGVWRTLVERPLSQKDYSTKLRAARRAATAEQALAAGDGLPAAVLEYIAGAVAFNGGEADDALTHFKAIDRLPIAQRRLREVAAAYMQARTYQMLENFSAARTAFQATRERALAGAPDPMGLGVASLGDEARLDLMASGLVKVEGFTPSDEDRANAGTLIARAVRLYAEQAARGSAMARLSLREVASLLADNETLLRKVIGDETVRRLLVAYCIANDGQSDFDDAINGSRDEASTTVIGALLALPQPTAGDDVDRLAMLAYQTGRYEAAERLTASTDRALGLWVRAKLGLRRGDRTAAIADLTAAVKATTAQFDQPARVRLQGELAVAKLSDGKFQESMQFLFPLATTYWGDVAYVADRVLTVDELKTFVDGLPADGKPVVADAQDSWLFGTDQTPTAKLRELLGRRLMREGRLAEAQPYFPAPIKDAPDERAMAADYRAAVEAEQPTWRWRNVSRAEALFKVATLTRTQGMELMGTEGPPDFAALDGSFDFGVGQSGPWGQQKKTDDGWRKFVDPAEIERAAASAPKPDVRFHYRAVAADRALEAAALLPHPSEAYAATLCWGARYAKDVGDVKRAWSIYKLYVSTGPYQPWAKTFGSTCPDPDFDGARHYWPKWVVREAQRHPALAAAAGVAIALLIAGSVVAIRRRRVRA